MSSRSRTGVSAKTKSWRVTIFILGDVEAPSREAAESVAVRQFALSAEDRNRIVIQERA